VTVQFVIAARVVPKRLENSIKPSIRVPDISLCASEVLNSADIDLHKLVQQVQKLKEVGSVRSRDTDEH